MFVETDAGLSPNANSPAIVAAIEAAVADGMDVINFSGGEPEIEPSRDIVALALDAAAAAGVVPVIAAGNDYNDVGAGSVVVARELGARDQPSARSRSAARRTRRVHAEFSSVGPTTISLRLKPDVAAPGVDVLSSVPGEAGRRSPGRAWPRRTSRERPRSSRSATRRGRSTQVKSALVQTGVDAVDERESRSPGPQFQGGGVVALATGRPAAPLRARRPLVSFGLLDGRGRRRDDDASASTTRAAARARGRSAASCATHPRA